MNSEFNNSIKSHRTDDKRSHSETDGFGAEATSRSTFFNRAVLGSASIGNALIYTSSFVNGIHGLGKGG